MLLNETIVAVSSAGGGGGRGIVRVSGERAWELAREVARLPEKLEAGWHGEIVLPWVAEGIGLAGVLLFKGPRSFTGEDVVELHVPGSEAIVRGCVERILAAGRGGVRLAGPGEFSARAFFNGKMDLTEAEGIAATINAATETELRAAKSLREGNLHREVVRVTERVAHWLALVEAGIDFADEEGISFVDLREMCSDLSQIADLGLQWWLTCAVRMDRLDTLPTAVFIGEPNVGKSSLINALAGTARSITSAVAGTTRDMLSVVMQTSRGEVRLLDVPGKEEPVDELRRQMMKARETALLEADLVIEVVADEKEAISDLAVGQTYGADTYTVQNKADLLPPAELRTFEYFEGEFLTMRADFQLVSAKTGLNIEKLREEIGRLVHGRNVISQRLPALNQRHRLLLQEAKEAIDEATCLMNLDDFASGHPELVASELRRALDVLGQITGAISPDEILGRIFSTFCIGK